MKDFQTAHKRVNCGFQRAVTLSESTYYRPIRWNEVIRSNSTVYDGGVRAVQTA